MTDDLLALAIATTSGRELWKTLCGSRINGSTLVGHYASRYKNSAGCR